MTTASPAISLLREVLSALLPHPAPPHVAGWATDAAHSETHARVESVSATRFAWPVADLASAAVSTMCATPLGSPARDAYVPQDLGLTLLPLQDLPAHRRRTPTGHRMQADQRHCRRRVQHLGGRHSSHRDVRMHHARSLRSSRRIQDLLRMRA